ncbi:MAG: VWA domain-containing protein [Roseiflexaceae bacterium]
MDEEPTFESEKLYMRGMAQLRAAQWKAAVETLSELRSISTAYPEADTLIADALLKTEIDRLRAPDGMAPPKKRMLRPRFLTAVLVLFALGGALLIAMRPFGARPTPTAVQPTSTAPQPTSSASLPTPAPTNVPPATPEPSATVLPTAAPVADAGPGMLQVRMADGQALVRTIGNLEIILDASGSMNGEIDGRRKIDIAHEALASLVGKLPDRTNVALRAYGHRTGGDCSDVELLTPLGTLDRGALTAQINAVNPAQKGMTPIGASLEQVAQDLQGAQGDVLVVLVSDGDETCDGDPAQVATRIHADNPKIRFDVIGFNVGPEEWRTRLSGIAQGGGGSYFDAKDAAQLVDALQQAVALTYRVLDAQGAEVFQGQLGAIAALPAGRYTVEIRGASPLTITDITVGGATTAVDLLEEDGVLKGTVAGP